ncbi:transposase-like protein [Hirsutella rhossiliensis]|uniref:Transposase-like protein n=1 Tax=Hirsutella rhossiliensis TaxID=111463 RepID=A0A9P8NBJ5_9HYPO|nr:transposase-like protein [Hirsutella rhossiliensis]KAH0968142.1 transposase-like protein [Hirsutella rhossiliensis]
MASLDSHRPKDQALMNAFIASFDPLHFQNLLIRWVACDNVPFHKLESPYFRELMDRINISFDGWSSRNFRTFLLGLPQIEGRHTGENLADRVSEIIHEYGLEDCIGYFVTDNAESNDTCLEDLGVEFGFNKQHRRLRCCGHIINLVARSILFGADPDAFEEDCQAHKEIRDEMKLWRSEGPIGKLHNIVHWVQRSGQRIEKLHKLQLIENTALNLEDKTTYDVISDNATRWNSSEAMMQRGYRLRNTLDSMVQAEVTEWNQYVARRTQNGTKPMPKKSRKKPAIVDDKMSVEDWSKADLRKVNSVRFGRFY